MRFLWVLLLGTTLGFSQDPRGLRVVQGSPSTAEIKEARVALVIGNGAYKNAPLKNPVNDARAMKRALEVCGFKVTLLENVSKKSMEDGIRTFGVALQNAGTGLFYFAGHGVQMQGANYLVPVDAQMEKEDEVSYAAVDADLVLKKMETAKNTLNILILDACRNNPFARTWRSADKGLAPMNAPTGSLVAFATAPGQTASDGNGENSPYTTTLIHEIREPGVKLLDVFQNIRKRLAQVSGGKQVPWELNSTIGDFYFRPLAMGGSTGPSVAEREEAHWATIKDSKEANDFDTFLEKFPKGAFAEIARMKKKSLVSAVTEPPPPDGIIWDAIAEIPINPAIQKGIEAYDRKDFQTALAIWRPLAQKGDAEAQYRVGLCYDKGTGVAEDKREAIKYFINAADQESIQAQIALGKIYGLNDSVSRDGVKKNTFKNPIASGRWFKKAAVNGDLDTMFLLLFRPMQMNYNIDVSGISDSEKFEWSLKLAKARKLFWASLWVANNYEQGIGVTKNFIEAAKWYRIAAEEDGWADAQEHLGQMYYLGLGVSRDEREAYIWWSIATANGSDNHRKDLEELEKRMSKNDLDEAQREALKRIKKLPKGMWNLFGFPSDRMGSR